MHDIPRELAAKAQKRPERHTAKQKSLANIREQRAEQGFYVVASDRRWQTAVIRLPLSPVSQPRIIGEVV